MPLILPLKPVTQVKHFIREGFLKLKTTLNKSFHNKVFTSARRVYAMEQNPGKDIENKSLLLISSRSSTNPAGNNALPRVHMIKVTPASK